MSRFTSVMNAITAGRRPLSYYDLAEAERLDRLELEAERDGLLRALKRAEYLMVGTDYLDALGVVRDAIKMAGEL